jgi:hypothetical protein
VAWYPEGHRPDAPAATTPCPTSPPSPRPQPDRRRALELLASCRDGCTEALSLAHGFAVEQMVELVRTGLASVTAERVVADSRKMEVARVRITDEGRRVLAEGHA